jgi:hypothetical protein
MLRMPDRYSRRLAGLPPQLWLLAFAASVFVFHQVPALLPHALGDALDLLTPFAVVGSSTGLLMALGARRGALAVAMLAGILYVDGHGIHLSANSIHNQHPVGRVEQVAYFWDERFSHTELVLGWFGLVASFCLAEGDARRPPPATGSRLPLVATTLLLGFTFFTSTVEGQTWWLLVGVTPLFVVWAWRRPRALVIAAAGAYLWGTALVGAWAILNGGVPQFSDVGVI